MSINSNQIKVIPPYGGGGGIYSGKKEELAAAKKEEPTKCRHDEVPCGDNKCCQKQNMPIAATNINYVIYSDQRADKMPTQ